MSTCDLEYKDILQEIERFGGVPSDKPFFIKRCQVTPYCPEAEQTEPPPREA